MPWVVDTRVLVDVLEDDPAFAAADRAQNAVLLHQHEDALGDQLDLHVHSQRLRSDAEGSGKCEGCDEPYGFDRALLHRALRFSSA